LHPDDAGRKLNFKTQIVEFGNSFRCHFIIFCSPPQTINETRRKDLLADRLQMVNWAKLGVGKFFRPHYHQDMEEIFVILKGKSRIRIQGEEAELGKEEVVVIPGRPGP